MSQSGYSILGGQGVTQGALNEHGFGLKNALALLTGGNSTDFDLYTRSAVDSGIAEDSFLHVTGPLSTEMEVEDDPTRGQWAEDLHYLKNVQTGTKVRAVVRWQYFRTVYKRGASGFDILAARFAEHLGVKPRHFLKEGNEIKVSYRRSGNSWTRKLSKQLRFLMMVSTKLLRAA